MILGPLLLDHFLGISSADMAPSESVLATSVEFRHQLHSYKNNLLKSERKRF